MKILIFVLLSFVVLENIGYSICNPVINPPFQQGTDVSIITDSATVTMVCDGGVTLAGVFWRVNFGQYTTSPSLTIGAGESYIDGSVCWNSASTSTCGTVAKTFKTGRVPFVIFNSGVCTYDQAAGRRNIELTYNALDPDTNYGDLFNLGVVGTNILTGNYLTNAPGNKLITSVSTKGDHLFGVTAYNPYNRILGGTPYSVVSTQNTITVNCSNLAPILNGVSGVGGSVPIGQEYQYFISVQDPDNDSIDEYRYVVVEKPINSSVPVNTPVVSSINNLKFTPDVVGSYKLLFSALDSEGTESNTHEINLTGNPEDMAVAMFKVKLNSDNLEYSYADCAPNNDDCKLLQSQYLGGEFYKNENIKLDATDSIGTNITEYKWKITKPDGNIITKNNIIDTFNETSMLGDYTVELIVNNGADSDPLVKKFKVVDIITARYFGDGPFYMTTELSGGKSNPSALGFNWGNVGGESFSSFGCVTTSISNIFNRDFQVNSVYDVDRFFAFNNGYRNINRLNFSEISRIRSIMSGNNSSHFIIDGREIQTPESDAYIFSLARKRKYALFKVDSVRDNRPPEARHYVLLNGVQLVGINKVFRITDPSSEVRVRLDDEKFNNFYYSITALEKKSGVAPISNPRLYLETSDPNITFLTLVRGKNKYILNKNKIPGSMKNKFEIGSVELDTLANANEDQSGSEMKDGYLLTVDNATPGIYSVDVAASSSVNGYVNIYMLNSNNQQGLFKTVALNMFAGETKTINFEISDSEIFNGNVSFQDYIKYVDSKNRKIIRLNGTLLPSLQSDGIEFSDSSESILSIGNMSYAISNNLIQDVYGSKQYKSESTVNGITYFRYNQDGNFVIEISDLNLTQAIDENKKIVQFQIGNDVLNGVFSRASIKAGKAIYFNQDKLIYESGNRATGLFYTNIQPSNEEVEFGMEVFIDGNQVFVNKIAERKWAFSSPILASGVHLVTASLFVQDKRLAQQTLKMTQEIRGRLLIIDEELERQTDPEVINQLSLEKLKLLRRKQGMEYNLRKTRSPLGTTYSENIYVN